MLTKPPPNFYPLIGLQCLINVFIALVCYPIFHRDVAFSVLGGGLTSGVANGVFTFICFSITGFASRANAIVSRFYLAEGLKFLVTVLLFALAIRWHLLFFPLLTAYFIAQVSFSFLAGSWSFSTQK